MSSYKFLKKLVIEQLNINSLRNRFDLLTCQVNPLVPDAH